MLKFLKSLANSSVLARNGAKERIIGSIGKQRSQNSGNRKNRLSSISTKPLSEPLEGFEELIYIDPSASKEFEPFSARMTTMPNGLRVVTEPIFGEYCTLGVAIDAGTRHESNYPQGTCHFLEKLAFAGRHEAEEFGAIVECQSSKDVTFYASSCHKDVAGTVAKLISNEIYQPNITTENVEFSRSFIKYENDALVRNTDCEPLLIDWIHQAAFRNNTLGHSKYCESENASGVDAKHLFSFLSQYYTPDRIVLGGVGVEHDVLLRAAEQHFDGKKAKWVQDPSCLLKKLPVMDKSVAQYTGGEVRKVRDLSNMAPGPSPFPNLAHLVIGFEGASFADDDYVPFNVLQSLLGGGGSFSAGGPGKGMFTRLYIDVLHNYGWMYNATAYNMSYEDAGLFCVRASAPPNKLDVAAEVLLNECRRLTKGVEDSELDRAKVQLKSNMMMTLEMRPVMFENLARQTLVHKEIRKPQYYTDKIDQVRSKDIVRAAERMLNSKLSVAAYGDLRELPTYERIQALI